MNRRDYIKQTALMLGYTFAAGTSAELMSACKKEAQLDWSPVFLSKNQGYLVAEIAETILPETATPGAKALGVPQFIDLMLKDLLNEEQQQEFLDGLKSFEEKCENTHKKDFVSLSKTEREAFLVAEDRASPGFPTSMWGINLDPNPKPITFYRRLKSLCLMGFYNSEKIGKEVLVYDPIPGGYQGCIPLNGQNAWSE